MTAKRHPRMGRSRGERPAQSYEHGDHKCQSGQGKCRPPCGEAKVGGTVCERPGDECSIGDKHEETGELERQAWPGSQPKGREANDGSDGNSQDRETDGNRKASDDFLF